MDSIKYKQLINLGWEPYGFFGSHKGIWKRVLYQKGDLKLSYIDGILEISDIRNNTLYVGDYDINKIKEY